MSCWAFCLDVDTYCLKWIWMCILAMIWLHNIPGLFLRRPEAWVFQVWLWSKCEPILARGADTAVHAEVVLFISPGHQAGGSSGTSQGAHAHNSSLFHTSWVAILFLDVLLLQLCAGNRRTIMEMRSLCIFSIPGESVPVDHSNDLFILGKQEGKILQLPCWVPSPWRVLGILSNSGLLSP